LQILGRESVCRPRKAIGAAKLPIMAKQRLKIVQRDLFEQLDRVPF
jgi:hypothetical protein